MYFPEGNLFLIIQKKDAIDHSGGHGRHLLGNGLRPGSSVDSVSK